MADDIAAADWTSDGTRVAVVRAKAGLEQLEFPIGNVLYQTTGGIQDPRISPGGDLIAFLEFPSGSFGVGSIATIDAKKNKKTLTQLWQGIISGLAWSPSSDEVLFTATPYSFTTSLRAVNRSGRQRLVANLPGDFSVLDAGSDGRREPAFLREGLRIFRSRFPQVLAKAKRLVSAFYPVAVGAVHGIDRGCELVPRRRKSPLRSCCVPTAL